jgi:NTP pyrophosphatase (non-canonical NTP hydrolase)
MTENDRAPPRNTPPWYPKARELHEEFLRRAQAKGCLSASSDLPRFFALAIAGEAGELANLWKKEMRGDVISMQDVAHEMADVRIYLEHLAAVLGIDLDFHCAEKLQIVQARLDDSK